MNISSIARACVVLLILVGLGFCGVGCSKQPPPSATCDACGTVNDLSANFCVECGEALVERCPGCSREIRVGVRFCPDCGVDLVATRAEEARRAEEEARRAEEEARRAEEARREEQAIREEEAHRAEVARTLRAAEARRAEEASVLDLGSGVSMRLVEIKPGRFRMGSPRSEAGRYPGEALHEVTISKPYWLGKTEVTQAQWQAVMGTNPSYWDGDLNLPVERVSWDDAQEFCRRLSQKTGMTFRLPTEAEWEYACRAGTQTAYSFGDDPGRLFEYAWFGENSGGHSHSVATKLPNAWGLYDMHGNVWEWVEDWYGSGYYAESPSIDPPGPISGTRRVLRGGSWGGYSVDCRAADRGLNAPDGRFSGGGFRVARTP